MTASQSLRWSSDESAQFDTVFTDQGELQLGNPGLRQPHLFRDDRRTVLTENPQQENPVLFLDVLQQLQR